VTRATAIILCLLPMLVPAGCASSRPGDPRHSTRLTVEDIEAMAAAMADSLARSDALAARTPDSERWVISIDKVLNLSSDVMTESEQWAIIAKVRGSLPIQALARQKNVVFVMPPERVEALKDELADETFTQPIGSERHPTHTMTATFRSVTRADAEHRTELYYCEFELLDLGGGPPVWADRFEYKRQARGHIWD
jgi:hypothetical protein